MEISIEDIRAILGQYVLEIFLKDKKIAELEREIEKIKSGMEASRQANIPRPLEVRKENAQ